MKFWYLSSGTKMKFRYLSSGTRNKLSDVINYFGRLGVKVDESRSWRCTSITCVVCKGCSFEKSVPDHRRLQIWIALHNWVSLLGAFANCEKGLITLSHLSVRPSFYTHQHGITGMIVTEYHKLLSFKVKTNYLYYYKLYEMNSVSVVYCYYTDWKYRAFSVACSEPLKSGNVFMLDNRNSSFATKSCAFASALILTRIICLQRTIFFYTCLCFSLDLGLYVV
jgi:hypothetical protein